jgi:hypothetical protein
MQTRPYRLLNGKHFGFDTEGNRKSFTAGQIVQLTDVQYNAFKDRFVAEEIHAANEKVNAEILAAQEKAKDEILAKYAADEAKAKALAKAQIETKQQAEAKALADAKAAAEAKAKTII